MNDHLKPGLTVTVLLESGQEFKGTVLSPQGASLTQLAVTEDGAESQVIFAYYKIAVLMIHAQPS